MRLFRSMKARFPKALPVAVFTIAALGGLGIRAAYDKLSAAPDCCYPGSPCCYPGAPCCEARKHAVE